MWCKYFDSAYLNKEAKDLVLGFIGCLLGFRLGGVSFEYLFGDSRLR